MLKSCSAATDAIVDTDMKMDDQKEPVYDEAWANEIYANKHKYPMVIFDKKTVEPNIPANNFIDQFVDLLLREVNKEIPDKEKLPDEETTSKDIGWTIVFADIKLYNGYLTGANTVRREGQAVGSIHDETIDLGFGAKVGPLYVHYTIEVVYFSLIVVLVATAFVRDIDLKINVEGTLGKPAKLKEFKITNVAVPKIHVSGLGPFDWLLDKLLNFLALAVSSYLGRWLEGSLKNQIQKKLDENPLPASI